MNNKPLDAIGVQSSIGLGKIDIIAHEKPESSRSGTKSEFSAKKDEILPLGNIGTGRQAIEFALTIDDHYDMREFLKNWQHGDIEEWSDYQIFLSKQEGK